MQIETLTNVPDTTFQKINKERKRYTFNRYILEATCYFNQMNGIDESKCAVLISVN